MSNVFIIGPFVETLVHLKQGQEGEGGIPGRDEGVRSPRTQCPFRWEWSVEALGAPWRVWSMPFGGSWLTSSSLVSDTDGAVTQEMQWPWDGAGPEGRGHGRQFLS